jgi:hypothetical protein
MIWKRLQHYFSGLHSVVMEPYSFVIGKVLEKEESYEKSCNESIQGVSCHGCRI